MTSDQQPWPASIFQHKCGEPRFNSDVQEWEYRTDEADGPRLISEYNFGSMSIYGSFPYVRTNSAQWRTTYERIRVVEGYHLIKNAGTRQCLSVGSRADGALVYEAPCNVNSRAQMWSFRRPSPSPEEGLWAINVETGKCMTSDQRPWPASTFQHKCGEPRFNADVQRWTWRWEQIGSPNTHLMNEYNSGFTSIQWSVPTCRRMPSRGARATRSPA